MKAKSSTAQQGANFLRLPQEAQQELIEKLTSIGNDYRDTVLSASISAALKARSRFEPLIAKYGEGMVYDATFDERLREAVATPLDEDTRFNMHLVDVIGSWILSNFMNEVFDEPDPSAGSVPPQ